MTYAEGLELTKQSYPFDRWHEGLQDGLDQYTKENCDKARDIFDLLIRQLIILGAEADESLKLKEFERCVLALNDLDEALDCLCDVCNLKCPPDFLQRPINWRKGRFCSTFDSMQVTIGQVLLRR